MGGAASANTVVVHDLEAMVACTFLLGQAINRVFPDIYCLPDFHFDREKLQRRQQRKMQIARLRHIQLRTRAQESKLAVEASLRKLEQEEKEDAERVQDEQYTRQDGFLVVPYGAEKIPLKIQDLGKPNEDGWTALHASCHQHGASEAASLIIEEMCSQGISLDGQTKRGPGSFASHWTALHICCAYGIENIALMLIQRGAKIDTKNSAGWTPFYECIHRGYDVIAQALLKAGARTDELIPPCLMAPHHPQYPLAHASRQGHVKTVKQLLDAGAHKDAQNQHGWTALHEAVFYRQRSCVQLLLVHGADVLATTNNGYRAIDIPTTSEIHQCLLEATPKSEQDKRPPMNQNQNENDEHESKTDEDRRPDFRLLGDLPTIPGNGKGAFLSQTEYGTPESSCHDEEKDSDNDDANSRTSEHRERRGRKATKKSKGGKGVGQSENIPGKKINTESHLRIAPPEEGVPPEFACQLSGKLMNDPFTTPYGNHFERSAIEHWLQTQGNNCPVTGMPLSLCEIQTDKNLRIAINNWQLEQALQSQNQCSAERPKPNTQDHDLDLESAELYEF